MKLLTVICLSLYLTLCQSAFANDSDPAKMFELIGNVAKKMQDDKNNSKSTESPSSHQE